MTFYDPEQPGISAEEKLRRRWELIDWGLEQIEQRKNRSKIAKFIDTIKRVNIHPYQVDLPPTRYSSPS